MCSRYLFSRAVTRQVSSTYMSLTSVFGMGSDGSAAGGGSSDLSEWQRSIADEVASATRKISGTATGANELNFCVRDGRELARRLWRSQGQAERGPQSARKEPALSGDVSAGHRNRKQVDSPPFPFAYKKDPSFRLSLLCWHYLSSRAVARQVLSAQMSLTSVFGMGTGGPSSQSIPTRMDGC